MHGFLQAREPRLKACGVVLVLLAALFTKSAAFLFFLYILCLLTARASAIRLGFFLKRTWVFIPIFSLIIAAPAMFATFSPGEPVFSFKILNTVFTVTRQGLAGAGIFFMRVLTSVSWVVLLSLTTGHFVLLKTLRRFGVPQIFVMTLGMCYRYIYLLLGIVQDTYTAVQSRTGGVSSYAAGRKITAWNIANLWQRSYKLQKDVYGAMLSRGYNGEARALGENGKNI